MLEKTNKANKQVGCNQSILKLTPDIFISLDYNGNEITQRWGIRVQINRFFGRGLICEGV